VLLLLTCLMDSFVPQGKRCGQCQHLSPRGSRCLHDNQHWVRWSFAQHAHFVACALGMWSEHTLRNTCCLVATNQQHPRLCLCSVWVFTHFMYMRVRREGKAIGPALAPTALTDGQAAGAAARECRTGAGRSSLCICSRLMCCADSMVVLRGLACVSDPAEPTFVATLGCR
jgi:hypothetical protein